MAKKSTTSADSNKPKRARKEASYVVVGKVKGTDTVEIITECSRLRDVQSALTMLKKLAPDKYEQVLVKKSVTLTQTDVENILLSKKAKKS